MCQNHVCWLLLVDESVVSFHIFNQTQVQKGPHPTDKVQSILFPVSKFYFWHISLLTFLSSDLIAEPPLNGRPIRVNHGKGGVIVQLEAVSKQIQKPTRPQRVQQPTTCVPNDAPVNVMAPPLKKKRGSKAVSILIGILY